MSHKDRSIANMRCEAKKIYYQRQEIKRLETQLNVYKAAIKEISEFVENLWNNNEEFAYTKYYSPNDAMVFGKLREMVNKVK